MTIKSALDGARLLQRHTERMISALEAWAGKDADLDEETADGLLILHNNCEDALGDVYAELPDSVIP